MKAQSLAMLAALVLSAAFSLASDNGRVHLGSSIVDNAAQVVEHTSLPKLSESAAQSSPNPPPSQTDNSTARVTSSGAVKASFTVVSPPTSEQGESGTSSTGDVAGDPNTTPATAAVREANAVATDDQPTQNDHLDTAGDVRPKSGWVGMSWVLPITAWLLGIAALCGLVFLRGWARK